jgi:hypothetical protein
MQKTWRMMHYKQEADKSGQGIPIATDETTSRSKAISEAGVTTLGQSQLACSRCDGVNALQHEPVDSGPQYAPPLEDRSGKHKHGSFAYPHSLHPRIAKTPAEQRRQPFEPRRIFFKYVTTRSSCYGATSDVAHPCIQRRSQQFMLVADHLYVSWALLGFSPSSDTSIFHICVDDLNPR